MPMGVRSTIAPPVLSYRPVNQKRVVIGQYSLPEIYFASKIFKSMTLISKSLTWVGMVQHKTSGPSCSKLTTSLVNDSLKFISSDT